MSQDEDLKPDGGESHEFAGGESWAEGPTPLFLRLQRLWKSDSLPPGSPPPKTRRWLQLTAVAGLIVVAILVGREGIAHVKETEVGVRVNYLTGDLVLAERMGYHLFVPYFCQFYELDKTIQRLDMSWGKSAPGAAGRDIKLKTADGSDVSLDVVINFKLIPERATEVLRYSGPGMRFAEIWMEPFARQVCLSTFGRLSSEEMYDAAKRNDQAQKALQQLNDSLSPHGIEVVSLIPGEFRFYREYEEVIQQKKLADQQVEEQQAQAREALENRERQLVEARKKADSQLAAFEGESANRLIQAKADADKVRREADGKYAATLLAADAALYSSTKQADGERTTLLAQAEGMERMRKAMVGPGGVDMVGLEYARHLTNIKFSATPITREPSVHQFAVDSGVPAAVQAVSNQQAPPSAAGAPAPMRMPLSNGPRTGMPPSNRPTVIPSVSEGATP